MTSAILEKEKEFLKLNAELEMRTKALMHEVDSVMKMQNNLALEANQNSKCSTKTPSKPSIFNMYESGDRWENYEENRQAGPSVLTKCLRTRLTILQNEIDSTKAEYKNKCNELKQLHAECSKFAEDRNKFELLSQSLKDQKEKLTNQVSTLNSKLQTKDTEIMSLRKENETLKKELKTVSINNSSNEIKLNKLLQENEKSKTNLLNAKQDEKELRDNHKKHINELICQNKRLEKQVTELTNGFRKQMLLVDNLKKQKMYLESAKLIQMSEEEFEKILDWKPSVNN